MPKVSAYHALNEREKDFCQIWGSMKFDSYLKNEAYRRAFYPEQEDEQGRFLPDPALPSPKDVTKLAAKLVKSARIIAWVEEMQQPATAAAVGVMQDQVLFGDTKAKRDAALAIFKVEEALEVRDAAEHHMSILCAIGSTVNVELPDGSVASRPLSDMFPQFQDAEVPEWVKDKTSRALLGRIKVLEAEKYAREEEDDAALRVQV